MDALESSYQDLPYGERAFEASHPDRLATVAALHGLETVPLDRCRVLELGCAVGGNLTPMAAALPGSRFLGIDFSDPQIRVAQGYAQELGLTNIEFRRQDILDFDRSEGPFDYIICHGVYSWVPPRVQAKIQRILGDHLSPGGVGIVSYNVYPGWYLNGMIRDILQFGRRGASGARAELEQALTFLETVSDGIRQPEPAYKDKVRHASRKLRDGEATYVYHEYLEAFNSPVHFEQFARRAGRAGLQYLDDAELLDLSDQLSDRARAALAEFADDPVRHEQCMDYIRGRTFRRSLLCRASATIHRAPQPQALRGLRIASSLGPESPSPDLTAQTAEKFLSSDGPSLTTNNPYLKSALAVLHQAYPGVVAFADLWAAVRGKAAVPGGEGLGEDADVSCLAEPLLTCARRGLVELHTLLPSIARELPQRPVIHPLARRQAQRGPLVVNLRHQMIALDDLARAAVALLDGTCDRPRLVAALEERARAGQVGVDLGDTGGRSLRDYLDEIVGGMLQWFVRQSLVVGD
jgi:protein-L-isoaspartate O-methyltransferase